MTSNVRISLGETVMALPVAISGIDFPENDSANSDVAIEWTGANLLNRNDHTALWEVTFRSQLGYYAVAWHNQRLNIPTIGIADWPASLYEFGTHPHPNDGTHNSAGQMSVPGGSTGTTQFFEIAGLGASDFIATSGTGTSYQLSAGVKYRQARVAETLTSGPFSGKIQYTYYVDLSDPTKKIVQVADPFAGTPVSAAFSIGASFWTGQGSNNETVNGKLRAIKLFPAALSLSDILIESASDRYDTAPSGNTPWYINVNPVAGDVSDKSGQGHDPEWRNSNRPTTYTVV